MQINMEIKKNISLKKFNTFSIDAYAENYVAFNSPDQLNEVLEHNRKRLPVNDKLFILGGGSNILFTKNISGLVLKNEIPGIEKTGEDENYVFIKAGAGVNWHHFVLYCLDNEYAGVENLALIPGSVGASPMQNIGAYGVELKDVFYSLEAVDVQKGEKIIFSREECAFGYRESVFKKKYKDQFVITSVIFKLNKIPVFNTTYGAIENELQNLGQSLSIRSIAEAVIKIRRSKLPDPAVIGNAGSFFKNPEIQHDQFIQLKSRYPAITGYTLPSGNIKLAAGWLIEQCGWKGYRKGDAGCHARQALVLVNYGNAKGDEVLSLSENIIISVNEKFGVSLEREVNII
jgi:UDP-N-acetylmuramate dehydrogenase